MTDAPVFVLGLGAQKAGTTWAQTYLSGAPGADFGPDKAYHLWDGLTVPDFAYFKPHVPQPTLAQRLKSMVSGPARAAGTGKGRRVAFHQDPESYFDFFAGLLAQPGISLTGDITPSYAALSRETLQRIRDGFDKRGIRTKALFLVRDPVDRCWSAVRMYRRNGNVARAREQGVDIALDDEAALRAYAPSRQAHLRTDYHLTIENLDAVFAAEDICIGSFERLFSPAELERISRFFHVPVHDDLTEKKINATEKTRDPSTETASLVFEEYRPVYDYFAGRFPDIRASWAQP